jgi:hypothetical protein
MERPMIVWAFVAYVALNMLFGILAIAALLLNPLTSNMITSNILTMAMLIFTVLTIPVGIYFLIQFFNLKKSSALWAHIYFGLSTIGALVSFSIFGVIINAVIWWAVWDYIEHKKVNDQMVFS